ncbi:MAG TPA: hypothetical protein EYG88_07355 [Desulfocapsa sulfexigens]|nr:hypothetical protein [Desulfocapsa sulfexigens]
MIKISVKGKILKGDDAGKFVEILDDTGESGGFLIITSPDTKFEQGHDDWVEDMNALEKYFIESKWEIEWFYRS